MNLTTTYNIVDCVVNGKTIKSPQYLSGFDMAFDYGGRQYPSFNSGIPAADAAAQYEADNQALYTSDPDRANLEYGRLLTAAQMAVMTSTQRADWDANNPG